MDRAFLGVGWKFPPQVTPSGAIATSQPRTQDRGVGLPDPQHRASGSGRCCPATAAALHDLVFAPDNAGTDRRGLGHASARRWCCTSRGSTCWRSTSRPRPGQPAVLLIRIDYRIRANNARGNLVYPFFITEGM